MPVFDHERMLKNLDNDEDLIEQLVFIFFQEKENFLEKIRVAIKHEDYKNIMMIAHTVKGMLGNFFAEDAVNSAIMLEKAGHTQDLNKTLIEFNRLNVEVEKLTLVLKAKFDFIDIKDK